MKTVKRFAAITFILFLLLSITCPAFAEETDKPEDPNVGAFELSIVDHGTGAAVAIGDTFYLDVLISLPTDYGKYPQTPYSFDFSFALPQGLNLLDTDPDPDNSEWDITYTLINEDKEFVLEDGFGLGTTNWNDGRTDIRFFGSNVRQISSEFDAKEPYRVYSYSKFLFRIGLQLETLAPAASQGIGITVNFNHTNLLATGEEDANIDLEPQTVRIYNCDLSAVVTDAKDGTPLPGAKFYLQNEDGLYFCDGVGWVETQLVATAYTSDENGSLTFTGLGSGDYTLTQFEAPKGYKLPETPIELVVNATCDETGIQRVFVVAGDTNVTDAPIAIQNEKEFPVVPVSIGAGVVVVVIIVLAIVLSRKKKEE